MNKRFLFLILMLLILSMTGCNKKDVSGQEEVTTGAGQHYLLYFLNDNEFSTAGYYTQTTDVSELVNELLAQMGLMDNGDGTGELLVEKTNVSNGIAYVYFNDAYKTMDNVYEVLFRASVVKTLSQLEEVNYVYFYIDNTALAYDNGQIVGLMSESDFIADSESDLTNLAWDKLTLYFADEGGQGLVERQMDVAYIKTVSMERLVVEQLIQGPDDANCVSTLNSQVKILGVTVKNGECYVNLDSSFIELKIGVPFELTLYSVVNSLCELETVDKVQFQINGDSHITANGFSFDAFYTRNRDLIIKEVTQ